MAFWQLLNQIIGHWRQICKFLKFELNCFLKILNETVSFIAYLYLWAIISWQMYTWWKSESYNTYYILHYIYYITYITHIKGTIPIVKWELGCEARVPNILYLLMYSMLWIMFPCAWCVCVLSCWWIKFTLTSNFTC